MFFKPVDSRPDFVKKERELLRRWYQKGIVNKYLKKNNLSKKRFSFLDGPITANNPMGVHHAWGRTYKDLWQRFYNLLGYHQRFQNGFDCQGLWVEVEVEKELGLKGKKEIETLVKGDKKASIARFIQLCRKRVLRFAAIQTEQSKRLGNFMDWDNSYYTMSDENNYMIWHFLKVCFDNGWIYKGRDSVPWCPRCQTAISQHEMLTEDYKDITHDSIYLLLPVERKAGEYLLVWTTTPWTLPANIAVAVDESLQYSLVEVETGEKLWIAHGAVKRVFPDDHKKILKSVKGKELVGLKYKGPFDKLPAVAEVASKNPDTLHTVIATDDRILPISTEEGTGLVHTAVSAGVEDFKLGKKHGLPFVDVIGGDARYLANMGVLAGKNAKKHPELIFDHLKRREKKSQERWILRIHPYTHRYPVCWRCKSELVWRVTDEWYISMNRSLKSKVKSKKSSLKKETFRERMIRVTKKIVWMPEFGLSRELDWLNNMQDWLISKKNRYWGLALPIYECKECGEFEVLGSRDELESRAVAGWDAFAGHTPHKPWIDEVKIACKKCGASVSRVADVGTPWLDAGIVPYSTITRNNKGAPLYLKGKKEWQNWFPADFITESFPGQFKNWFYALIAMSTALEDSEPFKSVLGFGTLLAEDGRPMHKSWGNAIEFNKGADTIGVDVMRWMYVRQNPSENMLFGYKKADEVRRQFLLMLWNCYRFFVEYANLDKFKFQNSKLKMSAKNLKMENILDKWIIQRFHWLNNFAKKSLKQYNAQSVAHEAERFVKDLSTWYIRRSRDRVWTGGNKARDKRGFYQTLHYVLTNLSIILSPMIPFITDEIYTNLTGEESVHLASWPKGGQINVSLQEDMNYAIELASVIHSFRKDKKIKVRIPIRKLAFSGPRKLSESLLGIVRDEVNVYELTFTKKADTFAVQGDVSEANLDLEMGEAREIIRAAQQLRRKEDMKPDEVLESLVTVSYPERYKDMIKEKVRVKSIKDGGKEISIKKQ